MNKWVLLGLVALASVVLFGNSVISSLSYTFSSPQYAIIARRWFEDLRDHCSFIVVVFQLKSRLKNQMTRQATYKSKMSGNIGKRKRIGRETKEVSIEVVQALLTFRNDKP